MRAGLKHPFNKTSGRQCEKKFTLDEVEGSPKVAIVAPRDEPFTSDRRLTEHAPDPGNVLLAWIRQRTALCSLGVVRARLITRSDEGYFEDLAQSFTLRDGCGVRIGAAITVVICRLCFGEPSAVRPRTLRQTVRGLTAPGSPNSDSC